MNTVPRPQNVLKQMALAKWGGVFDPFSRVFYWAENSFKDKMALKKA
jgi:hypothetical protein